AQPLKFQRYGYSLKAFVDSDVDRGPILGQKQTFAVQKGMSALPPIATSNLTTLENCINFARAQDFIKISRGWSAKPNKLSPASNPQRIPMGWITTSWPSLTQLKTYVEFCPATLTSISTLTLDTFGSRRSCADGCGSARLRSILSVAIFGSLPAAAVMHARSSTETSLG